MQFLPKGLDKAEQEWTKLVETVYLEGNYLRWNLGRNFLLAMVTVLYYDYMLTFNTERRLLWKNWSVTSITLLVLRYLSLFAHIPMVAVVFAMNWDGTSSDRYLIFPKTYQCIATACVTLILSIRVHCLWNNRFVTCVVVVFWIITNGANSVAWAFATSGYSQGQTSSFLLPVGCTFEFPGEAGVTISGHAWGIRMIYEMLILGLTIGRSWYLQGIRCQLKIPIMRLLTRNGVQYFIIILISECLSMIIISASVNGKQVMFNTIQIAALSRLVFSLQREITTPNVSDNLSLDAETDFYQVNNGNVNNNNDSDNEKDEHDTNNNANIPSSPISPISASSNGRRRSRLCRERNHCFLSAALAKRAEKSNRAKGEKDLEKGMDMREAAESVNMSEIFTCTRTSTRQTRQNLEP